MVDGREIRGVGLGGEAPSDSSTLTNDSCELPSEDSGSHARKYEAVLMEGEPGADEVDADSESPFFCSIKAI